MARLGVVPGVVNTTVTYELSIERDLIAKLIRLRDETPGQISVAQAHFWIRHSILPELMRLEGLEAREPGKSKFVEVPLIKKLLRRFAYKTYPSEGAMFKLITSAIADLEKLKRMELRFG